MSLRDCCDAVGPLGTESRAKPNQNNGGEGILTPEPTVGLLDLDQLTDEAMEEGNLTRPEMKVGFDELTPSRLVKTDELTNLLKRSAEQAAYSECIAIKQVVGPDGQVVFTNLSKAGEDLLKSDSSQTDLTNLMKSDGGGTDGQSAYSHFIHQGKVSGGQLAFADFLKSAEQDSLSGCSILMKSGEGTIPIPTLQMEDTSSSIPNLKMEDTSSAIPTLKMEDSCPMSLHPKLSEDDDDEDDDCPPAPTLELVLVDTMCLDCPSDDGGPPPLDRLENCSPDAGLESHVGGPPPLDRLENCSPDAGLESHVGGPPPLDRLENCSPGSQTDCETRTPVCETVEEELLITEEKQSGTGFSLVGTQQSDSDSSKDGEKLIVFESKPPVVGISERLALEANELRHCHVALDRVEIPGDVGGERMIL